MTCLRPFAKALLLLSLVAVAGCQTAGQRARGFTQGPTPVIFAQAQGWLVERYVATGPGQITYCVASQATGGPDIAFIATSTNTGLIIGKTGGQLAHGAVYELTTAFDGGNARRLRGKPMAPTMLAAPLGGTQVGQVLGRFASAGSVAVSIPDIGLRKRFELTGSNWAINKLSECMHGTPARYTPPAAKPAGKPDEKRTAEQRPTADAPAVPKAGSSTPQNTPSAPAPTAQAKSGVDLDDEQPVDLDSVLPNG